MPTIFRKMFLVFWLGFCVILTGCSGMLEENGDLPLHDNEIVQAEHDGSSDELSANGCYPDEEYISGEGICTAPIACDNPSDCAVWGEDMVRKLGAQYGSFVDLEAVEMNEDEEANAEKEEDIVAEYGINNNWLISDGTNRDQAFHEQLWKDFAWMIPAQERQMLTAFSVFSHVDTLAYVQQDENDLETWSLGINVEPTTSPNETVGTLIHEFGHLLMLNADQVNPYVEESECPTYYWEDGCGNEDSYIYAFQTDFWPDSEYDYDEDMFVSEYAATNFVEDIAESWMCFVLSDKPKGTKVADQKVLFFYQYDELVMLRAELLSRVASWMERNG
ncbi:hypothetical protein [Paenibacillus eucommiae]|uniref:Peptidase M43 pregnancy-associated plasma-A domain-containing protein n=1 Tax=Paenibacillus eucommiae TaxID=1355755 RepID=A0ABS4IXI4_9BACL|nr:hypothetical protein [Paenibacillus eucommiae]MBP1991601.1 hypothetical protein [Paenibacillus eucommiae]